MQHALWSQVLTELYAELEMQGIESAVVNQQARLMSGVVLAVQGQMDEAIGQFRHALQIRPRDTEARDNLAKALIKSGRADEAIPHLRHLLQVDPKSVPTLQRLAWILATHPVANVRDANDAVWFGQRAAGLTQGRDPTVLDTLAAAYAEAGQFDEAAETARKALRLAQKVFGGRGAQMIAERFRCDAAQVSNR